MMRLRWISSRSNWTAAAALADATSEASTSPRISPLLRSSTTRQRRFIRPASLAGLSFLLDRRDGAKYSPYPALDRVNRRSSMGQVRPFPVEALTERHSALSTFDLGTDLGAKKLHG